MGEDPPPAEDGTMSEMSSDGHGDGNGNKDIIGDASNNDGSIATKTPTQQQILSTRSPIPILVKATPKTGNERRNSRRTSDVAKPPVCTKGRCVDDKDTNKIQCQLCNKHIHYRCTGLPVFQIHHFLYTKSYRKFVCEPCTKTAEHLKRTVIPTPPPAEPSKEIAEKDTIISEKQLEVDTLAETNRILQAEIKEMSVTIARMKETQDREREDHVTLQAEAKILKTGIKTYEEKIVALQTSAEKNAPDNTITTLTELMAKKFEEVENNLKESILTEVSKNNKQLEDKINEAVLTHKSYANILTNSEGEDGEPILPAPTPDFRTVMREARNEQLAEEAEQKQRAGNFIVHGVAEISGEVSAAKKHDEEFIKTLMVDLGLETQSKALYRLGQRDDTREQSKRPIKVVMSSETEKELVMANLKNLKGKENYRRISITDDHTIKERNMVQEFVKKAKAANENEDSNSGFEWKVRGSPKNGMSIKKFKKRIASA